MRDITITKLEFDEFLFPFVTNSQAENDKERTTATDVLKLLSDEEYTVEETLSDELVTRAEKLDKHLWPGRKLATDEHTFTFEEDEYRLVRKRLTDAVKGVNIIALAHFSPLLDKFKQAEKYSAGAPEIVDKEGVA
jgi:hypothetical protein